ncbi:ten-m [Trichonephila clavipes]|nr:ten-m [Trichonephila clavipes]
MMVETKTEGAECKPEFLPIRNGSTEERITQHPDGSLSIIQRDSSKLDVETVPNPVLSNSNPVSGEMFPVPSRMRMAFSDDNVQYLEWHYFVHADGKNGNRRITRVGRKFKELGYASIPLSSILFLNRLGFAPWLVMVGVEIGGRNQWDSRRMTSHEWL